MKNPLLSACILTHRALDETLDSISCCIDEALIWCTTTEAKEALTENIREHGWAFPIAYPYVPWNDDFSALRNDQLGKAIGEWILYIDSDERLIFEDPKAGSAKLRYVLEHTDADAFFVPFWNWLDEKKTVHSEGRMIRIFRKAKAHFEQPVQNALIGFERAEVLKGVRIEHDGYDSSEKMLAKAQVRAKIYEKALDEDPESWHLWYHYCKNCFWALDYPECIRAGEKAITLLTSHGLINDGTSYVDVYRIVSRARLAFGDFSGAARMLSGGGIPGALDLAPRYSDAYYELHIIHTMIAEHYKKCWEAELELAEQVGDLSVFDRIYGREREEG